MGDWPSKNTKQPTSPISAFCLPPEHEITQINDDKMINDAAKMFSGNSKTRDDKKTRGRHLY